jgi:hypothetical protein
VTDADHAAETVPSTLRAQSNVYRDTEKLLRDVGWTQGRERARSGKLSLTEAVHVTVSRDATRQEKPHIVRVARMRRHLRELANTSNLLAWNDAPERRFDDILKLLRDAAKTFPRD